ncbi:MAG: hypothetical protein ACJAZG_001328, partial [Granulosicoccus sp.]
MKLLHSTYIICIICLCSCGGGSNTDDYMAPSQEFGFEMISPEIKDSLISLHESGLIPISISKVTALESEDNSTMEWILNNGKSQDFEKLLYDYPNVGLKVIGVKGLIRKKDKAMFKHLKYAIDQDMNVQYSLICQKLGGYFLYQLNYSVSDTSS